MSTAPPPGGAQERQNQSIENFAASLSTAAVIFGVQIAVFLVLSGNWKVRRSKKHDTATGEKAVERQGLFYKIYYYKTAFVPHTKRIAAPSTAIDSFRNVFTISDHELIRIAGVDGYLFLQYLQLLLRIFIPMALVILPILLPLNRQGDVPNARGLDSFAWPNVDVPSRLWAHCVLAVLVILWVCFNFYLALRQFVRLRQTVLTMPEHRIRASATTILVQSIPNKWLTVPALDALYDVFPGGIKDVWINRNYDDLMDKVNERTKIARSLESAETNLIIKCTKKHREMEEKAAKEAGQGKKSKKDKQLDQDRHTAAISRETHEPGMDANNPHQIEQQLQQLLEEPASSSSSSSRSSSPHRKRNVLPIPLLGEGIHAVGEGVDRLNKKVYGGVRGIFTGKQHHAQKPSQDTQQSQAPPHATDEVTVSSPTSPDYHQRGASSDTHTPLASKEQYGSDGTVSEPNSPKTDLKESGTAPLEKEQKSIWHPWEKLKAVYVGRTGFTSPQPFRKEGEEQPKDVEKIRYDFTGLYDEALAEDPEDVMWRKYLKPSDRDTMRLPIFNWSWWPSIPLIGKKVDTIYHCRKELARLNAEISYDQEHPERFPLMNSAFIQFNHQVAAHMACQSLSHHIPRQMNPRTVEVNPNYVLWDNLSMKWWERYLRMFGIVLLIVGLVIFWGIPVSFTGALSQIDTLTDALPFLSFIEDLPEWVVSFIQGVLPPAVLAILFAVLPLLLRFLAGLTGTSTSGERELLVQNFYFAFVFVQLFLVVSLSTGITTAIDQIVKDPISVTDELAKSLPKAANYFFSYMILQALSISSGTLLQIGSVVIIVFLGFMDTTPREKVSRVLSRPGINWGTMIPVYTNFGAIGLIYSVVSPLILVMMIITFSLFWFTYRYQMIYVSYAKTETNGLIFPKAVNQLFTGLYFQELCLIGLFFLQRDDCFPQAIIMIIMLIFTVLYQVVLNRAFGPLFTYLPITFEDEAVVRDEEWARAQASRWEHQPLTADAEQDGEEDARLTAEEREQAHLDETNRKQQEASFGPGSYELSNMDSNKSSGAANESPRPGAGHRNSSWANKSRRSSNSRKQSLPQAQAHSQKKDHKHNDPLDAITNTIKRGLDDVARPMRDIESQVLPASNLFDNIEDELADVEPTARQKLIKRSFQHPATRAIQPAVWIPHDDLGIAKDEIQRTGAFTKRVWITSVNARLDAKGKVIYRGLPPDRDPFENIEV